MIPLNSDNNKHQDVLHYRLFPQLYLPQKEEVVGLSGCKAQTIYDFAQGGIEFGFSYLNFKS